MKKRLIYKVASEPHEFQQIHRLNYRTFVEEIPQHLPNPQKVLVDRFHDENRYLICLDGQKLVGMMAMRAKRPFSLDEKVNDLDTYLPRGESLCEVRLLAIEPQYRHPGVLAGLVRFVAEEAIRSGYTLAVASGTVRQARLYARMGFVPFAAEVGSAKARYQPMYLTLSRVRDLVARLEKPAPQPVSFMPGPVQISEAVQRRFSERPISHRSDDFLELVADVKNRLIALTGAASVELLLGSGTLGNDVIAAQLKLLPGPGLLLANGEFGGRLVEHATHMGLTFKVESFDWGRSFDLDAVARHLSEDKVKWLWSVHCETSTGLLNDLSGLVALCRRYGVKPCIDCTSSLGTVPVDLRGVYLASSVSGKGLASYPGLSLVFSDHEVTASDKLPRYLDLGYYREKQGVPFTHSSNLVAALQQALIELDIEERCRTIERVSAALRRKLVESGFPLVGATSDASPAVITIALPEGVPSRQLGEAMEKKGWLLSYLSGYLLERNLIQICLMGVVKEKKCLEMVDCLVEMAGTLAGKG